MAALARDEVPPVVREGQRGDGLPRPVRDVALLVLAGVVEHHGAAGRVGHQAGGGRGGEPGIVRHRHAEHALELDLKRERGQRSLVLARPKMLGEREEVISS